VLIEARPGRRNDCRRPECCSRNPVAQSQRASINAEDVMGKKLKLYWAQIASLAYTVNQCTSDGTRARRKQ
jgi:hypothetical protein